MTITYRWLGVAGLEFRAAGYTLLIDPFFTRPSKLRVLSGLGVAADPRLVARCAPRADAVLVSHAHYDHIMDVPAVLRHTGAPGYGSPNVCALLKMHGVAADQVTCIQEGDRFDLGPFGVEVLPARHTRLPLSRLLNGPMPERVLRRARLPLHPLHYRMDTCYSFRLNLGGLRLLVGNHPAPADVLFIAPYRNGLTLEEVVRQTGARLVVPIHWDDFMRPLDWPLLTMPTFRAQGGGRGLAPLGRLDLDRALRPLREALPGVDVRIPRLFVDEEIPTAG